MLIEGSYHKDAHICVIGSCIRCLDFGYLSGVHLDTLVLKQILAILCPSSVTNYHMCNNYTMLFWFLFAFVFLETLFKLPA